MAESVHSEVESVSNDSIGEVREVEKLYKDFCIVTILAKGNIFSYVVPSFPIFNADIMELKLQWEEIYIDGSTKLHVFKWICQGQQGLGSPSSRHGMYRI